MAPGWPFAKLAPGEVVVRIPGVGDIAFDASSSTTEEIKAKAEDLQRRRGKPGAIVVNPPEYRSNGADSSSSPSRWGPFTSVLNPELESLRSVINNALAPTPGQPVMARSRTGALYPSEIGTPAEAMKGAGRGAAKAGIDQIEGFTSPSVVGGAFGARVGNRMGAALNAAGPESGLLQRLGAALRGVDLDSFVQGRLRFGTAGTPLLGEEAQRRAAQNVVSALAEGAKTQD
jgi:hypothetical protein